MNSLPVLERLPEAKMAAAFEWRMSAAQNVGVPTIAQCRLNDMSGADNYTFGSKQFPDVREISCFT
jgi:hypothetical protein